MRHPDVDSGFSVREDLDRRLDRCHELILASLEGLDDERARATLVPGRPSLLGIVRHTAYVEAVWFDQAVTGRELRDIGVSVATANSWRTRRSDTIVSVTRHCRLIHAASRDNLRPLALETVVHGRGPRTVLSLMTHVLEELSWNVGQLDILRAIAVSKQ